MTNTLSIRRVLAMAVLIIAVLLPLAPAVNAQQVQHCTWLPVWTPAGLASRDVGVKGDVSCSPPTNVHVMTRLEKKLLWFWDDISKKRYPASGTIVVGAGWSYNVGFAHNFYMANSGQYKVGQDFWMTVAGNHARRAYSATPTITCPSSGGCSW